MCDGFNKLPAHRNYVINVFCVAWRSGLRYQQNRILGGYRPLNVRYRRNYLLCAVKGKGRIGTVSEPWGFKSPVRQSEALFHRVQRLGDQNDPRAPASRSPSQFQSAIGFLWSVLVRSHLSTSFFNDPFPFCRTSVADDRKGTFPDLTPATQVILASLGLLHRGSREGP